MDLIRILCAILLPPLGVFLQVGIGLHFWINILLTLLGYIPGIVHAVCVVPIIHKNFFLIGQRVLIVHDFSPEIL